MIKTLQALFINFLQGFLIANNKYNGLFRCIVLGLSMTH